MKINLYSSTDEAQVQIIPLIDIIFCILTFFLLAALQFTRQQAINIDLPKAASGTTTNENAQVSREILPVTIDALGQTYVEKQAIDKNQLAATLRDYLQKNPQGVLVLNASRSATYNDVIEVLDLLRQVGGDRVSLGIIPGPSQNLPPAVPGIQPAIPNPQISPGVTPNTIPGGNSILPGIPPTGQTAPIPANRGNIPVSPAPNPGNSGNSPAPPAANPSP